MNAKTTKSGDVRVAKSYKDLLTRIISISSNTAFFSKNLSSIPGCEYTVKSGDSLWNIALRKFGNGAKYPDIVGMNPSISNSTQLRNGQLLRLCYKL
jgi:hypothetical protein